MHPEAGSSSADLAAAIRSLAEPAGDRLALSLVATRRLAEELGRPRREIELAALAAGVVPSRYLRNVGTLGLDGQIKLLRSRALVVGAGGLGGYVVEGLARVGVGRIHVIDGDTFQDHNLNRQLLCAEDDLGRLKAEVARLRAERVNGAVEAIAHTCFFDESNADELLRDADVAVDALDSIPSRLLLQEAARRRGIPMIHGAIAGFYAQAMTIFPEDLGLFRFYRKQGAPTHGVELQLGNPAATPMLCAAVQVHEAVKVLLDLGTPLRDRLLAFDARDCFVEVEELG